MHSSKKWFSLFCDQFVNENAISYTRDAFKSSELILKFATFINFRHFILFPVDFLRCISRMFIENSLKNQFSHNMSRDDVFPHLILNFQPICSWLVTVNVEMCEWNSICRLICIELNAKYGGIWKTSYHTLEPFFTVHNLAWFYRFFFQAFVTKEIDFRRWKGQKARFCTCSTIRIHLKERTFSFFIALCSVEQVMKPFASYSHGKLPILYA